MENFFINRYERRYEVIIRYGRALHAASSRRLGTRPVHGRNPSITASERKRVNAKTGVTQGCVLGSAFFCLAIQPIIEEALASTSVQGVHAYCIADDINPAGEPRQLIQAAIRLQESLRLNADLTVKKIDILMGSQCRQIDTTELTGMDGQINIINTAGVDVGQERGGDSGARIVGAPVGSPEYAAKFVADIVDKHRARLDHIAKFGEAGHAQEALLLLRLCACPRITFLLQCVPYNIAPQAFNDSYRDILGAFGRIAGMTEELDTADEVTRGRIALPLRHGG